MILLIFLINPISVDFIASMAPKTPIILLVQDYWPLGLCRVPEQGDAKSGALLAMCSDCSSLCLSHTPAVMEPITMALSSQIITPFTLGAFLL